MSFYEPSAIINDLTDKGIAARESSFSQLPNGRPKVKVNRSKKFRQVGSKANPESMESSDSVALNETDLRDENLMGKTCCSKCQVSFQTGMQSSDSIDICKNCAMETDPISSNPCQRLADTTCTSITGRESMMESELQASCGSVDVSDDCGKIDRPSLQESSRRDQLEAPCDSMATCSKCYLPFQRSQTSCDSIDVCSQCAMRPATANIPSRTRLPEASCDSVCANLNRPLQEASRINLLEASCNDMEGCSKCQSFLRRAQTSCDSINVCEKCLQMSEMSGSIPSRTVNEHPCESMANCSKCCSSLQRPQASREPINICESCAENCVEETIPEAYDACKQCKSTSLIKSQTSKLDVCKDCAKNSSEKLLKELSRIQCEIPVESINVCSVHGTIQQPSVQTCQSIGASNECAHLGKSGAGQRLRSNKCDTQKSCQSKVKEEGEELEDDCKVVKKPEKKTSKKQEKNGNNYSKKYLKMKYEIELQNYLIDKMNRELQCKTLKCRPECELSLMKHRLDQEVNKLNQMIKFAINMQRKNHTEKWGPIPISTISEYSVRRSRSCPREPTMKLKPPQTPSGISLVSGFEQLDDLLLCQEKELYMNEMNQQAKQKKLQQFSEQMQHKTEQLQSNSIKCEVLFDMKSNSSQMGEADVNCQLKSLDASINQIVSNAGSVKSQLKKLADEFNAMKAASSEHP